MKTGETDEIDEMKEEYDFSNGRRGLFRGLIKQKTADLPQTKGRAVCIHSANEEVLLPRKIYTAVFIGDDLIQVTDETGENALFSSKLFLRIHLPAEIEAALDDLDKLAA